ncbi:hypothetical protein IFM89_024990 [Coptis chinensis]|uniref:KIB1-4 beta-propeller domain-containing protein n=1 Tax=Coptis chinensis TaxID=261450 RepID=A0A835LVB5_9MAGN|nr:hypothetical protein IFM89_024990 [Coptis chinensis]
MMATKTIIQLKESKSDVENKSMKVTTITGGEYGFDWSELLEELVYSISQRFLLPDMIRFGCVCPSWKSVSAPALRHKGRLPWLVVPYTADRNVDESDNYCRDGLLGFFSILDGITYKIETPELRERRILGASFGWFTTVHGNSEMQLFQPLTKKIVRLPAISKFPFVAGIRTDEEERLIYSVYIPDGTVFDIGSGGYMRDTLLHKAKTFFYPDRSSSHPSIVVVLPGIFGCCNLHFCRPGKDDCWNVIPKGDYGYHDFTFYKGNFYALRFNGTLDIMNGLDGLSPPTVSLVASLSVEEYEAYHYLLASSDDLWKVVRFLHDFIEDESYRPFTKTFNVFKLDFSKSKWVEAEDIGDHAFFVGSNNSFSVIALDFPGCRENCIYFADDDGQYISTGGHDNGIFNLKDGSIEAICPVDAKYVCPRPMWYSPNIC